MTCIGFIGLGDQGAPMADAIVEAGFALRIWARRPEVAERFVARGAVSDPSPAALAAAVDQLALCVVDEADVRDILEAGGALDAMRPGTMLLLHSTVAPAFCRSIAAAAAERGIGFVDAPVSGGHQGAAARRLLVFAGGEAAAVEQAMPVLRSYARDVRHMGEAGAGQTAKILNNLLLNANLAVAHSVLRFGASLGLDRVALRAALLEGTAASTALDWLDRTICAGHPARLGRKDIRLALELAGVPPAEIEALAGLALAGRVAIEQEAA